jgi:sec-independent protein translocase protein TatC
VKQRSRDAGGNGRNDPPRTFLEHLADLRRCLICCVLSWLAATLLVAPLAPLVLRAMTRPLRLAGYNPDELLRGQQLGVGVAVLFKIMLWGGLALSLPLLFYFTAQFVFPGLRPREKRLVRGTLVVAGLLFVAGVLLAYKTTLALAIRALFRVNDWMGIRVWPLRLDDYVQVIARTLLAFGIAFQLPLALLALGWCGLLPARLLRAKRRHAIVIIFVLAMILTPPDPVSQIVMALPMCLLYEICILLISLRERGRPDGKR